MQHRTKRDLALIHLVSEYEKKLQQGDVGYFDERDYFQLIYYFRTEHRLDKAIEAVDLALEQYQFRADFYLLKARLLLENDEAEEALQLCEQAELISPTELDVQLTIVMALIDLERYSDALDILRRLDRGLSREDRIEILSYEVHIRECMKQYEQMYQTLKEILRLDPDNNEALERIWVSVELAKTYRDSVAFHKELIEENPYSFLAWYNLGHAYACIGEYERSIDALEYSFLINEQFEMGYRDCAEICCQIQRFEQALSVYRDALNQFGPDSELLASAGECLVFLNRFEDAKDYLNKALHLDPYHDEVSYYLGRCFAAEQKWSHAIRHYQKALQLEDRREEYYDGIAFAYWQVEDYAKADYYYSKATETGPEQSCYWVQHARFLLEIGEPSAALSVLDEAEYHTVGTDLLFSRAACYYKLELTKQAYSVLEEALMEDVDRHPFFFRMVPEARLDQEISSMIRFFEKEITE